MRKLFFVAAAITPLFFTAACDNKGPAEKTGEKIDDATQSVKDAIDPPGPIEKAGRAVDETLGNKK